MHKPEALTVMVLKACLCTWEHVGRFPLWELRARDRGTCKNGSNRAFMWHLSVSPKTLARDPLSFACHTNQMLPNAPTNSQCFLFPGLLTINTNLCSLICTSGESPPFLPWQMDNAFPEVSICPTSASAMTLHLGSPRETLGDGGLSLPFPKARGSGLKDGGGLVVTGSVHSCLLHGSRQFWHAPL